MINDDNEVRLSGILIGNIYKSESNGKLALNFTIETKKYSGTDSKCFPHSVVMFDPQASKVERLLVNGAYVKARGHLLSQPVTALDETGKPTSRYIDKVAIDYIEIDEE
jgi:hypothetical protein